MKLFILSLFLTLPSYGVRIEFIGPCLEKPFYSIEIKEHQSQNVGELSIKVLEKALIPFKGNEKGINQILNSPMGLDAFEVVSDNEMMAYGWCYEVDGRIPEVFPDELSTTKIKNIRWFYGYAHFFNGQWVAQCLPSYKRKSPMICKKK